MISIVLILIGFLPLVILTFLLLLLSFASVLSAPGIWKMFLCWRFDSMSDFLVSHPFVCSFFLFFLSLSFYSLFYLF